MNPVHRLHITAFTLLSLALVYISGCVHLDSDTLAKVVKKPTIDVEGIAVTGLDLKSVDLLLTLNVNNPNSFGISLTGYRYDVQLNDKSVVSSDDKNGFSLPGRGDKQITVPVTIGFSEVMALMKEVKPGKPMKYRVAADLFLDVKVMKDFKVSTSKEGELNIPQIPKVAFKDIKVSNLSFSGAKLDLILDVDNPNGFPITVKDIEYTVSQSGKQWVAGEVAKGLNLTEGEQTTLTIPFSISFSQVGSGVLNLLRSGNFSDMQVGGQFTVDSNMPGLKNLTVPLNFSPFAAN